MIRKVIYNSNRSLNIPYVTKRICQILTTLTLINGVLNVASAVGIGTATPAQALDVVGNIAVGGRTGRDGIHGATFSSAELTHQSESLSGGAVQIGNAITEKMMLDVMFDLPSLRDVARVVIDADCVCAGKAPTLLTFADVSARSA